MNLDRASFTRRRDREIPVVSSSSESYSLSDGDRTVVGYGELVEMRYES